MSSIMGSLRALHSKTMTNNNNNNNDYNNLAQKEYKSRHNSLGKVNYWELCKRLKFDHDDK